MGVRATISTGVLPLILGMGAGCVHSRPITSQFPASVFKSAPSKDPSLDRYIIQPPDLIEITSKNVREIDGLKAIVQADGQIELGSLGRLRVGGLSPKMITEAIGHSVGSREQKPDVRIQVIAESRFISVVGRGGKRLVPYTGGDDVIRTLARAGLSEHFWPRSVVLSRLGANAQRKQVVIDMGRIYETGDLTQDYELEAGDVLTVGEPMVITRGFRWLPYIDRVVVGEDERPPEMENRK